MVKIYVAIVDILNEYKSFTHGSNHDGFKSNKFMTQQFSSFS